ncbi:hypothetical protein SVIRM249S_06897 [Streptomyces viridochromogenes]
MKLEVVVLPVSDVDRAKAFYAERLGWRLDADFPIDDGYRIVQVTPPGSECSVIFGRGLTAQEPGTLHGLQLTVTDVGRGAEGTGIPRRGGGRTVPRRDGRLPPRR